MQIHSVHKDKPPGIFDLSERSVRYAAGDDVAGAALDRLRREPPAKIAERDRHRLGSGQHGDPRSGAVDRVVGVHARLLSPARSTA